ncbi:STM3941 family protein [Tenacibaculum sp. MEBiC06402]|uniref:STM3941 family protein n=1 Tax=unclassified Tenacibaculum TaxID=2635139 RepID=UPI003B99D642
MSDKIEIEISKTKTILLFIGALLFVVAGAVFILMPERFINPIFKSSTIITIVGISSVIFFGLCVIFISRKLFKTKIGLIIDENGITDNTNATNVGLINWEDIIQIRTLEIASTKIMMLDTNKPEKYIDRAKNGITKRILKANYNMYGSPISITSNSLNVKYDELEKIVHQAFEKHRS